MLGIRVAGTTMTHRPEEVLARLASDMGRDPDPMVRAWSIVVQQLADSMGKQRADRQKGGRHGGRRA